jgi:hypothetical protein
MHGSSSPLRAFDNCERVTFGSLAFKGPARRFCLLVVLPAVQDLLLSAKHLFVHLSTVMIARTRG